MSRLPILMYHDVSDGLSKGSGLTISVYTLEQQFKYLSEKGYVSYHFSDLKNEQSIERLHEKSIIITFDDVYESQYKLVYPLLKKYNLKASFFIPFGYIGGVDAWNTNTLPIMTVEDLKKLDSSVVELGLHSFEHKKYHEMQVKAIEDDLEKCEDFIKQHGLDIQKVLAYPYGKYPRKGLNKELFFNCLKSYNINYGLRIGNRINRFPFKNNYEVQRVDIKGEDSLLKFKLKIRFGKLKLF